MKNEDSVLQKLCERLGCPKLLAMLTTTPWRNVQPILIRVLRDRATQKNASMLLHEYESKGEFYGVSATGQHALHNFASAFYATLPPTYQSVELSPITPFGLNAVLTKVSQDVTLSSIRGSEVVSDPTTPMALECASRRKALLITEETRHQTVNLATLHRVLRLQPFDKQKGYMQHFRLSGLCAGGRDTGRGAFFIENISGHISIWLDFVNRLNQDGYEFRDVEVKISDIRFLENLITFLNIPREIVNQHSLDDDFDLS